MQGHVGLRKGGASWKKAEAAGLKVEEIAKAVKGADVVMILLPDENIPPSITRSRAQPQEGCGSGLAHGFNVHYNQVIPRDDCGRHHGRPKGPGPHRAFEYLKGGGVPS